MSFVLRFTPTGFPAAKYDEVPKQLEAAGAGAPKGRSYHVCYGEVLIPRNPMFRKYTI